MLEALKGQLRMVLGDDEVFDLVAQGLKKTHTALIKVGFTDEQATAIVAGQGASISSK